MHDSESNQSALLVRFLGGLFMRGARFVRIYRVTELPRGNWD